MLVDVVCFLKNFRSVCLLFFGGGTSVQSISVQSRDRLGRRGDMTDGSAEIFFQSLYGAATVISSDMCRDVHSLTLSSLYFSLLTTARPTLKGDAWFRKDVPIIVVL